MIKHGCDLRYWTLVAGLIASGLMGQGAGCASLNTNRDSRQVVEARELTSRGLDAVQQGDWKTAESLFKRAVTASPHDERAHYQYARALWRRRQCADAIQHMHQAVDLSARAPDMLVELGRMQLDQGDLEAAWQHAWEAVAADAHHVAGHALLGDVLRQHGSPEAALEHYHRALDGGIEGVDVPLAVADIYLRLEMPRRGLATLKALPTDELLLPEIAQVRTLRGMCHRRLTHYAEAVRDLEAAAELAPHDVVVLEELAEAHLALGDLLAAQHAAAAAAALAPERPIPKQLLTRIAAQQPRLARGMEDGGWSRE